MSLFENSRLAFIDQVSLDEFAKFECSRVDLNEFLYEDALAYHEYGLTHTTLVIDQDDILGFFSLSADALQLTKSEVMDLGLDRHIPISYFPAVKLTKLAINQRYAGQGLGSLLLSMIDGIVFNLQVATRFITVDAVNQPEVIQFYEKNGFINSLVADNERKKQTRRETVLMYKDIYVDL